MAPGPAGTRSSLEGQVCGFKQTRGPSPLRSRVRVLALVTQVGEVLVARRGARREGVAVSEELHTAKLRIDSLAVLRMVLRPQFDRSVDVAPAVWLAIFLGQRRAVPVENARAPLAVGADEHIALEAAVLRLRGTIVQAQPILRLHRL